MNRAALANVVVAGVTAVSAAVVVSHAGPPAGAGTPAAASAPTSAPAPGARAAASTARLTVRVRAAAAKWVSTEVGGAQVVARDADTGVVLATGLVAGTSGDTAALMAARTPLQPASTAGGAASAVLAVPLDRVTRVEVVARGPLVGPAPVSTTSAQVWLAPGDVRDLVLTVQGLVVTVTTPAPHATAAAGAAVPVVASVSMLCGCPISTATPWRPGLFRVRALVAGPGGATTTVALRWVRTDTFAGSVRLPARGSYVVTVLADMASLGNTGAATTTVVTS